MTNPTEIDVAGRRVSLSNLDKVLWPKLGLSKAWVVEYYTAVAPVLVPHLRGHPLTLHRFPDGVEGVHCMRPGHRPILRGSGR